ncbi:PAS domain S-box protein [Plectonema radiosum NIES-515]|uniref:histidine kinase n=1 Tax=Plectonema radiosum NIES-515 TaxID=2986073 RepID=A0ABT3AZL3_9CYAN|nr:PAS domain S-box protein [Plectonema radiosum]MCV3214029.1 PAS domain S-box protein [Plectonema radiosum NIES-515]
MTIGKNLEQAIKQAHERLNNLLQRAEYTKKHYKDISQRELFTEAIAEISISLEELQVLGEELQQQNDELVATRHLVEAERQRYQDLFDFAPDAYFVTDTNGTIQEANHAAAQLLNVRQSYFIRKPLLVFVHPAHRPKFRELLTELQQETKICSHQTQIFHQDGKIDFPAEVTASKVEGDGKPVSLRWLLRDITERQQTQQKIREQAALIDITTDAIIVRDLQNQILFWNKGAENLYGWQTEDVTGYEEIFSQDSLEIEAALKTVVESGSWQGELRRYTRKGKELIVATRWTLMRDNADLPKSILSVDTDITEKKQLELQVLRAQRLESLGTLASGISHDLNNIFTPIMTVAQLLPMKLKNLDERSLEMLDLLESSAKHGADLVQQILSFARGSEGKRSTMQPSYLLEDIAQIIKGTFPKSINLNIDIAPDLLTVVGDASQLHQVFINLCLNARDAMPNGGDLSISAVNLCIDALCAKMNKKAKVSSYVLITITDTGVGISPKIIDRIFDPFFTTKDIGKGTGLGLSIAIGIINSHGGFLDVSSEVGLGSQFQVYLTSSDRTIIQPVDEMELLTGEGQLILVVDDEAAITQITKTTLEIHNYRVLTAEDGIEALALYNQYKQEIRVVLMDIMMPSMAGATAIRTLQRMNPQVQIIAMSGLVSAESLAQARGAGIQGFLLKPFSAKDLLNILQGVLVMD